MVGDYHVRRPETIERLFDEDGSGQAHASRPARGDRQRSPCSDTSIRGTGRAVTDPVSRDAATRQQGLGETSQRVVRSRWLKTPRLTPDVHPPHTRAFPRWQDINLDPQPVVRLDQERFMYVCHASVQVTTEVLVQFIREPLGLVTTC